MSMVYSKASQRNKENAVAKAKQVKPLVKVQGFGQFEVKGSDGVFYPVTFSKNEAGEFVVTCGCKGNGKGSACYHAAACSSLYKKQVFDRAAERAAQPDEVEPGAVATVPGQVDYDGAATVRYCSSCGFRYATGDDGLCSHCRNGGGAAAVSLEADRLAAIRAELFG